MPVDFLLNAIHFLSCLLTVSLQPRLQLPTSDPQRLQPLRQIGPTLLLAEKIDLELSHFVGELHGCGTGLLLASRQPS